MTLATHIVIAAAIVRPLASFHPAIAFFASLATHYAADSIPHWDYSIGSVKEATFEPANEKWELQFKTFLIDIIRFAADAAIGASITYYFFRPQTMDDFYFFAAVLIGATLPDFLQGLFYAAKMGFLRPMQVFHDMAHTRVRLHPYPLLGIPFQAIFFFGAIYFLL